MLKVKFVRIENAILMKVLKQPLEIERGEGHIYEATNGIILASNRLAEISTNQITLLGENCDFDNNWVMRNFRNPETAIAQLQKYTEAISEYNTTLLREKDEEATDIEFVVAE